MKTFVAEGKITRLGMNAMNISVGWLINYQIHVYISYGNKHSEVKWWDIMFSSLFYQID